MAASHIQENNKWCISVPTETILMIFELILGFLGMLNWLQMSSNQYEVRFTHFCWKSKLITQTYLNYFHYPIGVLSHFSCKAILTLLLCRFVPYPDLKLSGTNTLHNSCHICTMSIHSSSILCHLTSVNVIPFILYRSVIDHWTC